MSNLAMLVLILAVGLGIGVVGIQLLVAAGVLVYGDFRSRLKSGNGWTLSNIINFLRNRGEPGTVSGTIGTGQASQTGNPQSTTIPGTLGPLPLISPASSNELPDPSDFLPGWPDEEALFALEDDAIDSDDEDDEHDELLSSGYQRSEYHEHGATDDDIEFWGLDQPGAPPPEAAGWAVWDQSE